MKRLAGWRSLIPCLCGSFLSATIPANAQGQPPKAQVTVINAESHAVTTPVRDMPVTLPPQALKEVPVLKPGTPRGGGGGGTSFTDGDLKPPSGGWKTGPTPGVSFAGIGANGYIPPDTNLAAGAGYVVETVNVNFAIWSTAGNLLKGPVAIDSLFASVGGLCSSNNGGDPIVLYDQIKNRWLISQLAYSGSSNYVCVAVSTTSDPTKTYNTYSFNFGGTLPDYPKFGVWSGAYYFTANLFKGSSFQGATACAFDQVAMVNGNAATAVCFTNGTGMYNILPASVDGTTLPSNSAGLFLQFVAPSTLNLYQLSSVSFTGGTGNFAKLASLSVGAFQEACGGSSCVPQLNTNEQLDSLGDRLMYRLAYRNFGDHESLVVNHSVQINSSSKQTGIRWYEIQNPYAIPSVKQQSTYSPDQSIYRWMGSIAQDSSGNMLLGYSTSNSSHYPGIAFTGRCSGDATNTMRTETSILKGTGSQTNYNRWGDYSAMAIDSSTNTFWYANEYLPSMGSFNWNTNISSFQFGGTCN